MKESTINNGYGLKNMKDRVKEIHGEISIDSSDKGTKISFSIPF
jgi:signal transduction histidine kinase